MAQISTKVQSFINPEKLLKSVPILPGMVVADFGSGNGYYAVAAGAMVGKKGQVYALDILEDALSQTATLAKLVKLSNITTKLCNLEKLGGSGLDDTGSDLVMIGSILHQAIDRDALLREAYRVLKTGGRMLVVEWQPDAQFGPSVKERISEEEARQLLEKHGLRPAAKLPAGSFHYALLYSK